MQHASSTLKSGLAIFLGLELATDQLRASLVDESLELIGVESVDFDEELPEYKTQGGIFTTPGDAYTTPVEMWVKALDILLEKIHRNYDLTRIKSIGGAAQHAFVWWKSTGAIPPNLLSTIDPHLTLQSQFTRSSFSLPHTPVSQDSSSHPHAVALEALLGGPERMAARVGSCADGAMLAAQLLRIREQWPSDTWLRTGKIQFASSWLASLITGKWVGMNESEACATGMWLHNNGASSPGWDDEILELIGGSRDEGRRLRSWLGEVDVNAGGKPVGTISRYLVDRYGFDPKTIVTPFTSDYLATYLSLCPSPSDAVLSFGPMDTLLTPASQYVPSTTYTLYPHPAQDPTEQQRYIAVVNSRNADVPRALVRDMYTKSWSAFDRLVAIVPPGGSIGLDDKLFAFWLLQGDAHPYSRVKGIFRFETGIKVSEFRDLRANPRCLLESQILSFRVKWARMRGIPGVLTSASSPSPQPPTIPMPGRSTSSRSSLGLSFDPYDSAPLPTRILATGAAANFPSVANLVCDVFNAPVYIPTTQVASAQVGLQTLAASSAGSSDGSTPLTSGINGAGGGGSAHRNRPERGFPARATLGAAYVARWVWGKELVPTSTGGFEDEVRKILGKRWNTNGGTPLKTNIGGVSVASAFGGQQQQQQPQQQVPVQIMPAQRASSLGAIFAEVDEDNLNNTPINSRSSMNPYGGIGMDRNANRSFGTDSSASTATGLTPSTTFTSPDLNTGLSSSGVGSYDLTASVASALSLGGGGVGVGLISGVGVPTTPTPLTPVVAMPTADAEMQLGLCKVAEPDLDAFMGYAALVPEFSRLVNLVVKGLV